jgi:hypothetical protein
MSNKEDFFDNVILRLRREYSKDEVVIILSKQISEKDVEIGKLKSYIDELKYNIQESKKEKNIIANRKSNIKLKIDIKYAKMEHKLGEKEALLNRYKKANNELLFRLNNN